MAEVTPQIIKVLEIRSTKNGFVLTAFESETDIYGGDRGPVSYFSLSAETAERAAKFALDLMNTEKWDSASIHIPPARGSASGRRRKS